MFNTKQLKTKATAPKDTKGSAKNVAKNAFLGAGMKKSAETRSGNNALKYSKTDNAFIDEFGTCGSFKAPRAYDEIATSMSTLWAKSQIQCVRFLFYLRLITRVVNFWGGNKTSTTQRGQGLKHESIFRMMWLAINHPDTFWKNLPLFICIGSWKDIITMLSYDVQYNTWSGRVLDWNKMGQVLVAGLENPKTNNLLKKYLPQIKANSQCKSPEAQADNMIAKWICSLVYGQKETSYNYKKYRKLKTSGTAHDWQKLISQGKMLSIDFNSIHGRALSQLVSGKFLKNNSLEAKYTDWVEAKPVVKYTGYVYELLSGIAKATKRYQEETINKQFKMLVETAKNGAKDSTGLIVVRDTSGSMKHMCTGTTIPAGDVAKGLALFFSEMLPVGHFANSWIEFNADAKMHTWIGSTPVEKWRNDHSEYVGNTDFLSVIRLFARIKHQGIAESEFPTGILCISDGEFDPGQVGMTNVLSALEILIKAGFSQEYVRNFKVILWNLQTDFYGSHTGKKFETFETNITNVFYLSGLDGSVIAFLTGQTSKEAKAPETAEELFNSAMNQEVLEMVEV